MKVISRQLRILTATTALTVVGGVAAADQVFVDDVIVQGSICVGIDCSNGESFGFDTLRLKENNLRIKAQDTSSSASFPSNDWQITFNDSTNGGANKFSIDDIDGGRTPFTIEASAPSNSLYVDDGGRIGAGTNTPVVELHVVNGDSPTMRLEQDGSSGFTPQTWDVAGNETNFFVRDATNGSLLPFKIKPSAPNNSLFVDTDGDIGMGTQSPGAAMHMTRSNGTAKMLITETSSTEAVRGMLEMQNNGVVFMTMVDTSADGETWNILNQAQEIRMTNPSGAGTEFRLNANGDLRISGALTTGGTTCGGGGCDLVFAEPDRIIPLEQHMEQMWQNNYLPAVGPTVENEPFNVTDKVGRMLNALEHAHIYIDQLHGEIAELRTRLDDIETARN
ncbi:MAG: hypothetical protein AAFP87_19435 [Pseudomonadota bacterium]